VVPAGKVVLVTRFWSVLPSAGYADGAHDYPAGSAERMAAGATGDGGGGHTSDGSAVPAQWWRPS